MGKAWTLRPEEWAHLRALARRLATLGYTETSAGVDDDGPGPYVFVKGKLRGEPMERSFSLDGATVGLALQWLSYAVDREAAKRRASQVIG